MVFVQVIVYLVELVYLEFIVQIDIEKLGRLVFFYFRFFYSLGQFFLMENLFFVFLKFKLVNQYIGRSVQQSLGKEEVVLLDLFYYQRFWCDKEGLRRGLCLRRRDTKWSKIIRSLGGFRVLFLIRVEGEKELSIWF